MAESISNASPEEWRAVVGYEGWYEVSSLGRVRRSRPGPSTRTGYILRPAKDSSGYFVVCLCREAVQRSRLIHYLVATAFLGPRPAGHEVNHLSGDKLDCSAGNLEYATASANVLHAIAHGLRHYRRGAVHQNARLTEAAVRAIRASVAAGRKYRDVGAEHGVTPGNVAAIVKRRTWAHVL
jgi:hypothetical protein